MLLALGVSYVNELDQNRALKFLHGWLQRHPHHGAAASGVPANDDSSQALTHAIQCFQQAAFQVVHFTGPLLPQATGTSNDGMKVAQ